MEASLMTSGMDPNDTIPTWQRMETVTAPGSSVRLASERPPLPPPPGNDVEREEDGGVMVSHIHLGPSVHEVLYRLSLGDLSGAALANEELEGCVPTRTAAAIVIRAMSLSYLEEFMLAAVDGETPWGEILDSSPFNPKDTLQSLCELVDKGALSLTR